MRTRDGYSWGYSLSPEGNEIGPEEAVQALRAMRNVWYRGHLFGTFAEQDIHCMDCVGPDNMTRTDGTAQWWPDAYSGEGTEVAAILRLRTRVHNTLVVQASGCDVVFGEVVTPCTR